MEEAEYFIKTINIIFLLGCKSNEYEDTCYSYCNPEPTCLKPDPEPPLNISCAEACVNKCLCITGYIREDVFKTCITLKQCDAIKAMKTKVNRFKDYLSNMFHFRN